MKTYLTSLHPNIFVIRHGHPTPLTVYVSHHQKFVCVDQDIAFVGGLDVCLGRFDDGNHKLFDLERRTWLGVDYYNPHLTRPTSVSMPFEDVIDRTNVPRMPWHDIDLEIRGWSARDVARNFTQRWNHHCDISYPGRILDRLAVKKTREFHPDFITTGTCCCQVIRSLDLWSGASRTEASIYGAYLDAVSAAEHYIYIENQYLSSNLAGGGVENRVFQRILDKLRKKIFSKEVFRLIIVLPQPEEVGDDAKEILRWQYQTINRGGSSLLEQLKYQAFTHYFSFIA
jgi:phospholipase D1/2